MTTIVLDHDTGGLSLFGPAPWGTVTITPFGTGLEFDVVLNQAVFPTYFYNGPSLTVDIGYSSLISSVVFNGGATGHAVSTGVHCDTCGLGGNLSGYPQATEVSFFVPGTQLPTQVTVAIQELISDVDNCPVFAVGGAYGVAGVPEPATWALMLLGLGVLAWRRLA